MNSVSGAKMYEIKEEGWESYGAIMERSGENTQLYQVVHIRDDTLKYRAYTVTGELYDAFDLVQESNTSKNKLIKRENEVVKRTHENTIPY
ncbi:MAG: hypothetical protein U5K69_30165 [Balneolaceae bacterium]|nr:hypothetical protein [Balneolaceae bacterium]